MKNIPDPIFKNKLPQISWKKIYTREYGVQYSEQAILCLSYKVKYHIPKPSENSIVIPEGNNTVFYIDSSSWIELVESLNRKYTSSTRNLKEYENGFVKDGENYLVLAKKINRLNLNKLTNEELGNIYLDYQEKLLKYSVYAWTAFILNNYISDKATGIIDKYIQETGKESEKQSIYNSLFHPPKKAAILALQSQVQNHKKLPDNLIDKLYKKYNWLSCLDIHNDPWSREEFEEQLKSLMKAPAIKVSPFSDVARKLKIGKDDLNYLTMVRRFVYIKDARDDYRRQSVYYALPFFEKIGKRLGIDRKDVSYLQQSEVNSYLMGKSELSKDLIAQRKIGFIVYLDGKKNLICLEGDQVLSALKAFKLSYMEEKIKEIIGRVASQGLVTGKVIVVKGVKNLKKVKKGDILVAVTTHPDYVPAMRKASAIVTDEGGITSHAAIVSREFGIPCIVGTKNGTKILKDGDMVEVNAMEGKIKLL